MDSLVPRVVKFSFTFSSLHWTRQFLSETSNLSKYLNLDYTLSGFLFIFYCVCI